MKKSIFLLLTLCLIGASPVNSQGLLKKVAGSMKDELLGTKKGNTDPEPSCACKDAEQIVSLNGGKLQIDYKESEISTMDDGALLMKDKLSGKYYIVKDGVTTGPLSEGDKRLAGFDDAENKNDPGAVIMMRHSKYISKSGEKYIINFGGKQYGPFAQIYSFVMPKSGDKFAAIVVENIITSEADGKKMDAAIKNAKTQQEKMDLAMQYSQDMQQKIMDNGGAEGISQKMVTNVPGAKTDLASSINGTLNANAKYDEIVKMAYNKINDLTGKTLITLKPEHALGADIFVNTANTKYAIYSYGSITISDGTTYTDLFNPHLVKTGSQVYLAYMYYSPKKNAMMQCKIPW
jgi:hypothetical protein